MNIIFFAQSRSLDVFYEIHKRLKKNISLDKVGFYVSNESHYRTFTEKHPDFEVAYPVIKEWDIYKEAQNHKTDLDRLKHYQLELGGANLWTPYVTDRRLSFGKRYAYKQSYNPHFPFDDVLSIIDLSLSAIDAFFASIEPDLICTLYTATFGDCLGHQFAKKRGIRALDLRLSRLKNYVMFVDGVEEPPKHIKKIYNDLEDVKNESLISEAKDYIDRVRSQNSLYDGVLIASKENAEVSYSKNLINFMRSIGSYPKRLIKKMPTLVRSLTSKYEDDPQSANPIMSIFYKLVYKKINNWLMLNILKNQFVDSEYINNNKYIFFPLHVEPELVLSQFARPYLNQIEVVRNIRYSTSLTKTILVKDHPLMYGKRPISYYKKLLSIPNVKLVYPTLPSEKILRNCELLVIIRGAMGLEAAIKGIPVISLGKTLFELLPRSMYRFCGSMYELKNEIADLLKNYKYDEEALIKYLVSVIEGSCPANLTTDLLGKKGRYRASGKKYDFEKHPHLDKLTYYLIKRINQQK